MGLFRDVRDFAKLASEQQNAVVQVLGVKEHRLGSATIDVLVFTGSESPWQEPMRDTIAARIPKDRYVAPGMRLAVKPARGDKTNAWRIQWDAPEPQLPPMQFPQVPGGQNPIVMLDHLQSLVAMGGLPQEGYDRAAAYLERGGWPAPA